MMAQMKYRNFIGAIMFSSVPSAFNRFEQLIERLQLEQNILQLVYAKGLAHHRIERKRPPVALRA
jgi:hypothetical protein